MATTKKNNKIKIKTRCQTKNISYADFEKKLDMMIDELPVFKTDTLEALEALYRAEEFEAVTRYCANLKEQHFGYTVVREYDDTIEWIRINFECIPKSIFCAATRCKKFHFDFDKMVVHQDSSKNICVLNVEMFEELHNIFVDVIEYCKHYLSAHHINDTRYFYVYSKNDDELKTWIVPERELEMLCEGLSKQDCFEIEDNGFTLSFEKIPLAFFEREEFRESNNRYKITHLSEAIKRIMIDYFMSKDNE